MRQANKKWHGQIERYGTGDNEGWFHFPPQ